MTLDEFFAGQVESRRIFNALYNMINTLGPVQVNVTKSQVAFLSRRSFASAWMPGVYLHGEHPPLVLTVYLRRYDESPRWKEIVEPRPGRFTHHLELYSTTDIDAEVRTWLLEARAIA